MANLCLQNTVHLHKKPTTENRKGTTHSHCPITLIWGNSVTFLVTLARFSVLTLAPLTTTLLESARGPFWGRAKKNFYLAQLKSILIFSNFLG